MVQGSSALPPADPKSSRLRVGVIGAGRIAAEHFSFLKENAHTDLVAICDLSTALANDAARQYEAQEVFTDHTRMLSASKLDVVHICTPPHTHVPLATDCLRAGLHVICEKPIAPTSAEYLPLRQLAENQGKLLTEDHTYRFTRQFRKLETLIEEGRLGVIKDVDVHIVLHITAPEARYGDGNLRHPSHDLPAGVLHEFLPHAASVITYFLPSIDTVRAVWRRYGENKLFKFDDLDALVIGGDVHGRIRFSAQHAPDCFQIVVKGTKGWADIEFFHSYFRLTVPRAGGALLGPYVNHFCNGFEFLRAGIGGFIDKVMQRSVTEGIHRFLDLTYQSLREGSAPPISSDTMERSTRLIDALLLEENQA